MNFLAGHSHRISLVQICCWLPLLIGLQFASFHFLDIQRNRCDAKLWKIPDPHDSCWAGCVLRFMRFILFWSMPELIYLLICTESLSHCQVPVLLVWFLLTLLDYSSPVLLARSCRSIVFHTGNTTTITTRTKSPSRFLVSSTEYIEQNIPPRVVCASLFATTHVQDHHHHSNNSRKLSHKISPRTTTPFPHLFHCIW